MPDVFEREMGFQKSFWAEKGLPIPDNPWLTYNPSDEPELNKTDVKTERNDIDCIKDEETDIKIESNQVNPYDHLVSPFTYIHLDTAHEYRYDEIVKYSLIGRFPGQLPIVHIVRSSERAKVADLRTLIVKLIMNTGFGKLHLKNQKITSKNVIIIHSGLNGIALPPHGDEKTAAFPWPYTQNFDQMTTVAMLQNFQYSNIGRDSNLVLEYSLQI